MSVVTLASGHASHRKQGARHQMFCFCLLKFFLNTLVAEKVYKSLEQLLIFV